MTLDEFATSCSNTAAALRRPEPVYAECAKIVAADMARGVQEGVSPDGSPPGFLLAQKPCYCCKRDPVRK